MSPAFTSPAFTSPARPFPWISWIDERSLDSVYNESNPSFSRNETFIHMYRITILNLFLWLILRLRDGVSKEDLNLIIPNFITFVLSVHIISEEFCLQSLELAY